jgi:hypothetical protein
MESMNDTKARLEKIDKVRKELYAAARRLSWQNENCIWERSSRGGQLWCFLTRSLLLGFEARRRGKVTKVVIEKPGDAPRAISQIADSADIAVIESGKGHL